MTQKEPEQPPLAVDIDGTLTFQDGSLDPKVMTPLREWPAPVVVTTGKVLPNATALCKFTGVPETAVAETGGVVYADDHLFHLGQPGAADGFVEEYRSRGYDLGWGEADIVNRWRETEVAVNLDNNLDVVEEVAENHGLEVVDTGYAYHVKSPDVSKGEGLEKACEVLGLDPGMFVAVGDSENDTSTFGTVGMSFAVANADERALRSADEVTEKEYSAGFLEALKRIKNGS
ncbi:MAG: phosphoglycolate phosphatase [Halobacteria archaeon]